MSAIVLSVLLPGRSCFERLAECGVNTLPELLFQLPHVLGQADSRYLLSYRPRPVAACILPIPPPVYTIRLLFANNPTVNRPTLIHTKGVHPRRQFTKLVKLSMQHPGSPGGSCQCGLRKIQLRSGDSLAADIQASDLEGGMTVTGPPRSRMTRRVGPGGFSSC